MTKTHHPEHLLDRVAMAAMRLMIGGMKGSITGPDARKPFDELMEKVPSADGVNYEPAEVGGIPGWWCRPKDAVSNAAILYFHGGAYVVGSARAYQHFAGQLATRAKVAAFVPEYRRAPESIFPAAVNDAQAAYDGLVDKGFTNIAISGDSAGGGLALITLSLATRKARDGSGVRPICASVISAWTDLSLSGDSMVTVAEADPLSTKDSLASTAKLYLNGHDARDPLASPLFGDLSGLPPVRMDVGEDDILLDDSVRYVAQLETAGGIAEAHTWQGMIHVFPSNVTLLKAAKEALDDIAVFLRQHLVIGSTIAT